MNTENDSEKANAPKIDLSIPRKSEHEVVRTTFKLTEEGLKAMEWLQSETGTTIKNLVDGICFGVSPKQKAQSIKDRTFISFIIKNYPLEKIDTSHHLTRRTMVISRRAQQILNALSSETNIPRDIFIDRGFCLLAAVGKDQDEVKKASHKKSLDIIKEFLTKTYEIENKLTDLLGSDDPIITRFYNIIIVAENLESDIMNEIKNGVSIDPDSF